MTTVETWPTAAAIDARIAVSERVNGRRSALHGMGGLIVRLGERYGIHPGVVTAIMQRECQLGADGSTLPGWHNYGGVTDPAGTRGTCGRRWHRDRYWAVNCSARDGVELIYKVLDGARYRATNGTLEAVIGIYAPPFENDWADLWRIVAAVGEQLEVPLGPTTLVYRRRRWKNRVGAALGRVTR